jgi:uncharacterized surface protein with fasciclin (FAS1) repeats
MSLKELLNTAAAAGLAVALAAPAPALAQAAASARATTQGAAAKATGKPTADAPAATQAQGTAWAVKQAAQPGAGGAEAAAPAAAVPKVAPHGDIVETLRASGQFTTFLKAAELTNLTSVLKGNQNLTVFAPTDAAFAALPPGELDRLMKDPAQLQKLVTHHIINARVDSSKIRGAKGPVPSVAGDKIELDGAGDALKADDATIVQPDVMASNGVVQVVDKVLSPGAGPSATAAGAPPKS